MKIKLSINKDIINKTCPKGVNPRISQGYYQISPEDFINKVIKKGYAWYPSRFKGNYSSKKNFISSETIAIDIDEGWVLQDIFKDEFTKNNALLLYTSYSHSEKQHKFRLLFKLPKSITDMKKYEDTIFKLIVYYGADKVCRDCSHFFYGNTKAKVKIFGKTLTGDVPGKVKTKNELSEFESVEYSLRTKDYLSQMLSAISKTFPKLGYERWLTVCSSVWMAFSYEESIELLQQHYPVENIEDYKYKYDHRLNTIPYTYTIKLAVKCGFEIPEFKDFVRVSDKGKLIITPVSLDDFLTTNGFFTYFYNDDEVSYQLIRERKNIIVETGIKKICEFLKGYAIRNYSKFDSDEIRNYLVKSNMVNPKTLNYLNSPDLSVHKDTVDSSFFYFQNGYLKITENSLEFIDSYANLKPQKLWKRSIQPRNFEINEEKSEFEQFIIKKGVIGYALHRYKDPNINKCVVLNDETINIDNPNGRTGKSLIAEALGHVRNTTKIDGRNFDISDKFCFQELDLCTEIVNVDDVQANFKLKNFYSILTGTLKIERKREKSFSVPFGQSPKFIFSSNYTIDTGGGSDRARVVELSLYNCYNEYYQPKHEFGHLFFCDWDQEEWNRFYTFCAQCVQRYFKMGMLNTVSTSLMLNKLRRQTNEKFTHWVPKYDFYKEGKPFYSKKELYADFINFAKTDIEFEMITVHTFTKWVKIFFNTMEIPYHEKCIRKNKDIIWGYEILNR